MNLIKSVLHTLRSRGSHQAEEEGPEIVPELCIHLFDATRDYVPMSPVILSALSEGIKDWREILRSYGTPMACLKSDQGETVLHLAASWGHLEVVKSIVLECPCLLLEPNLKAQLPIHVAALAGHLAVVKALVAALASVSARLSEEAKEKLNIYVLKDSNGNTALHLALKDFYMEIAVCLADEDQRAAFLENNDGISPLYLAVEAGNISLVKSMLKIAGKDGHKGTKSILELPLEGRKYLAHAALNSLSTDTLDFILDEYPDVVDERDEEGRTCLSFGASMGYIEGVRNLLNRSTDGVFVCDPDGSYPIHVAIEKGHVEVVMEILKLRPDSKHLRNIKGQNILHIAADSGKYRILYHLTTCEKAKHMAKHMANEQDVNGNTPLHLATIKWRPRAIIRLVGPKNLFILNNSGLTPLDIAESSLKPHYIYRERLALMALVYSHVQRDGRLMKTMKLTRPSVPGKRGGHKEYINGLLLVAALIATVTFAAGFTIPGGFKSSAPHLGMASLAADQRLMSFYVFDTMALLSAIVAIFNLIWAQLGDPALYQSSIRTAMPALLFALTSMAYAFLYSVLIAAGNVKVLITIIYFIIVVYFEVMVIIIASHVALQRPSVHAIWGRILLPYAMFYNDDKADSYEISTQGSEDCGVCEALKQIVMPGAA